MQCAIQQKMLMWMTIRERRGVDRFKVFHLGMLSRSGDEVDVGLDLVTEAMPYLQRFPYSLHERLLSRSAAEALLKKLLERLAKTDPSEPLCLKRFWASMRHLEGHEIEALLRRMPYLTSLRLCSTKELQTSPDQACSLERIVTCAPSLEKISLKRFTLGASARFPSTLVGSMQKLRLEKCHLTAEACMHLSEMKDLRSIFLNLISTDQTDATRFGTAFEAFIASLPRLCTLKIILIECPVLVTIRSKSLATLHMGSYEEAHLALQGIECPSLTELEAAKVAFRFPIADLVNAIPMVRSVQLHDISISFDEFKAMNEGWALLRRFKAVRWDGSPLLDVPIGASLMPSDFSGCDRLEVLSLGRTNISGDMLAFILQENPRLWKLSLSLCTSITTLENLHSQSLRKLHINTANTIQGCAKLGGKKKRGLLCVKEAGPLTQPFPCRPAQPDEHQAHLHGTERGALHQYASAAEGSPDIRRAHAGHVHHRCASPDVPPHQLLVGEPCHSRV